MSSLNRKESFDSNRSSSGVLPSSSSRRRLQRKEVVLLCIVLVGIVCEINVFYRHEELVQDATAATLLAETLQDFLRAPSSSSRLFDQSNSSSPVVAERNLSVEEDPSKEISDPSTAASSNETSKPAFCPDCLFNEATFGYDVTCWKRAEYMMSKYHLTFEEAIEGVLTAEPVNCAIKEASIPEVSSDISKATETVTLSQPTELSSEALIQVYGNATTTMNDDFNLWDDSTVLPDWMKEYFTWHRQQRQNLREDNYHKQKYIVMICRVHHVCGGTADRLKPVPLILWFAYQHKRLFLIRWDRPAKLEEFLLPPQGGIDWRVPDWLNDKIGNHPFGTSQAGLERLLKNGGVFVRARYQTHHGGLPTYDELAPGPNTTEVYHDMWRTLFTPVPAIAAKIRQTQARLGLKPGQYAAAHARLVYARKSRGAGQTRDWAINAVACASSLRPGVPIYFASDTKYAVEAVQQHARQTKRTIVSLSHYKEPLHLEKAANWTSLKPSDFYDTFVDLYMLGMSQCLSYNIGGFGTMGLMLSYNASCRRQHSYKRKYPCNWTDPDPQRGAVMETPTLKDDYSIRPPMAA